VASAITGDVDVLHRLPAGFARDAVMTKVPTGQTAGLLPSRPPKVVWQKMTPDERERLLVKVSTASDPAQPPQRPSHKAASPLRPHLPNACLQPR
jgi:hypothetical protein